jgi:hypothetical protein
MSSDGAPGIGRDQRGPPCSCVGCTAGRWLRLHVVGSATPHHATQRRAGQGRAGQRIALRRDASLEAEQSGEEKSRVVRFLTKNKIFMTHHMLPVQSTWRASPTGCCSSATPNDIRRRRRRRRRHSHTSGAIQLSSQCRPPRARRCFAYRRCCWAPRPGSRPGLPGGTRRQRAVLPPPSSAASCPAFRSRASS